MSLSLDDIASPEYRALLSETHSKRPGWGNRGEWRVRHVLPEIVAWTDAQSVLDYGSGKGVVARLAPDVIPGVEVFEFEPGLPEKSCMPSRVDLVWCTHVLEHVEPERLETVLDHIAWLAPAAFFIIPSGKTREKLPDGRNAHLIQQPPQWWREQLTTRYAHIKDLDNKIPHKPGLFVALATGSALNR